MFMKLRRNINGNIHTSKSHHISFLKSQCINFYMYYSTDEVLIPPYESFGNIASLLTCQTFIPKIILESLSINESCVYKALDSDDCVFIAHLFLHLLQTVYDVLLMHSGRFFNV